VMGWFGPNGFFLFNAVLCAAIAAYAIYRTTRRAAPSPEETVSYTPVASRSVVAAETVAELYAEEADTN